MIPARFLYWLALIAGVALMTPLGLALADLVAWTFTGEQLTGAKWGTEGGTTVLIFVFTPAALFGGFVASQVLFMLVRD